MGDYIRWAPPYYGDDAQQELGTRSSLYLALNRGKRSVRLDLKSEQGREALLRLVESHDVVIDGFRPGVLERLGVGYERMREANPGIVFCAITGYGQDGPNTRARRPRHELPRPGRPARADRRQGRSAGPVGGPDRRHRRRRPDGRLRGDGRAARAPPLGRGPVRRRLDGRRRPLLAGAGRRPLLLRRRGAAPRRAAARRRARSATCPTRRPTAGSPAAPSSRSSGPPSATASSGPTWSSASSSRPAPRPGARSPRSSAAAPATSGRRSTTSTTAASSPSSTSTRRSTRSWSGRARWWSRWTSRSFGPVRQLGVPVKLSRTPGDPTRPAPGLRRAHRRGPRARPATPRRRSRR